MTPIARILFPTDFSAASEHAYKHALTLAKDYGAELHVLNVLPPNLPETEDPMAFLDLERESVDTWSDASHPQTAGGPKIVHARVRVATPTEGIVYYSDTHRIDMIVMSTHGRKGLDHFLIGSVAEEVVRMAGCPVYTVREHDRGSLPDSVRRILVPLDLSEASRPALEAARGLAARHGGHLDLLHVLEEAVFPTTYGVDFAAVAVPRIIERTRVALDRFAGAAEGVAVPYECSVSIGHTARAIVEFAEAAESDLIVIATHGAGGIERLLIGSVAEKVMRTAQCPVLVVRSGPQPAETAEGSTHREQVMTH